ncbi:MAG TPA: hypothetical protein VFT68_09830 [Lapillicoccus sp.]|nr:hypothetical protein [Lapillicoccus sp.]
MWVVARSDNEGLSLGYRILYRIRYIGLHMFGPAQLGDADDPHVRLRRERARKVAAAQDRRASGA